jgi:aarF domain-containing kinase
MAGKRLLDVAALFNASRGVAQKHVALRSRQLDVWSRTSTLAKAVKDQTDRVTETAKAASFLASRMNETTPAWAAEASSSASEKPIPSTESTEAEGTQSTPKEGVEQDHFYEPSTSNTSTDPVPTEDLDIKQEKAQRYPLADGTIPPADSSLNIPKRDKDVFSERPSEPAKEPLQVGKNDLRPVSSGESTIPIPAGKGKATSADHARQLQRQFERQIPSQAADGEEGHSKDALAQGHDEDVSYNRSSHVSPVLSSLPRSKIPKHTENTQGNDEHVQSDGINADYYSSAAAPEDKIPSSAAVPEQEQTPEGVNTELFYSPRIARMLGGKTHGPQKPDLKLKATEQSVSAEQSTKAADLNQDTFPSPETVEAVKSSDARKTANEEVAELAADISKAAGSSSTSGVSFAGKKLTKQILITNR